VTPIRALSPTQPSIQFLKGALSLLFLWSGHEILLLSLSVFRSQNICGRISAHSYTSMARHFNQSQARLYFLLTKILASVCKIFVLIWSVLISDLNPKDSSFYSVPPVNAAMVSPIRPQPLPSIAFTILYLCITLPVYIIQSELLKASSKTINKHHYFVLLSLCHGLGSSRMLHRVGCCWVTTFRDSLSAPFSSDR
jgi:hypothetical protein